MMTISNGSTNAVPYHRQNRRRERPGSRTRRTSSRRFTIRDECEQGILDARDTEISFPADRAKPSPLLRQNFDQSWQRWKAKQAEETAQVTKQNLQLEQDRILLFGGEVDDDELFRMGILYDETRQDCESHAKESAVLCDIPLGQEAPMFVMRPSRRSRRRSNLHSLPLRLSFSDLSKDTAIARLLASIQCITPTIQHRDPIPSTTASIIDVDIPQSLPPYTPALSTHQLNGISNLLADINTPMFVSVGEDWTFITHMHTQHDSTPSSEPETWSLCDDS